MTTNSLRIIAVGIAVVFAVLTGLFTGMVGGEIHCTTVEQPAPGGPGQNQEASPAAGKSGGPPGPGRPAPTQGGDSRQPAVPDDPDNSGDEIQVEAQAVEPVVVALQSCQDRGFSVLVALTGFFGTLLAAGAVLALWFSRGDTDTVAKPAVAGPPREHPDGDRSALVQACIYVRDRVTSKALADRLGWALQEAGVSTVAPAGARFDPALHEAGGSAVTADPAKAGTVAAVEMPGYVDRGVVLRAPVVTVYRQDGK
jgi:hypothetical protein